MTIYYHTLNEAMTLITAPVPDVVSLLEQINTFPSTCCIPFDLENAFYSIPVNKFHKKKFAFRWEGQQYTFTILPRVYRIQIYGLPSPGVY